jgi:3-carboxy-cis,cis-muconate cycloisomerase
VNAHIVDSALFRDQFGTVEMREIFCDQQLLQYWLDVEAALARAEGRLGIIPAEAARAIHAAARAENLDLKEVKRQIDRTNHPLMPLIRVFSQACPDGAGEYVHWGATTQDIMDTACVLQLRDALIILDRQLNELIEVLTDLARRYREVPMPGRTHAQHALPVTFGFKLAILLAEFARHRARLRELRPRLLVVQLGGAVGTLASFGELGPAVQQEFARELDLGVPTIAWHSARDAIAEFVCVVAMIGATCAKAANEVIQLQRTEIAEVEEPCTEESVGSSTMPQKRNPMMSESVVALGRILRQHAALAIDCMVQTHERDMSAWQAEWEFVPEATILLSGALAQVHRIYSGLTVRPERMAMNLQRTGGLITAEAVMMALAPHIGRQRAHEVVAVAARESFESGCSFLERLLAQPEIVNTLDEQELRQLLDPYAYLGQSARAADRALDSLALSE